MGSLALFEVNDHVCRREIRRDDDESGVEDSVVVLVLDSNGMVALLSTEVVEAFLHFVLLAISFLGVFIGVLNTFKHARCSHGEVFLGNLSVILTVNFDRNRAELRVEVHYEASVVAFNSFDYHQLVLWFPLVSDFPLGKRLFSRAFDRLVRASSVEPSTLSVFECPRAFGLTLASVAKVDSVSA